MSYLFSEKADLVNVQEVTNKKKHSWKILEDEEISSNVKAAWIGSLRSDLGAGQRMLQLFIGSGIVLIVTVELGK